VYTIGEVVKTLELVTDLLLDGLLNDGLHNLQQDRLGNGEQKLVVGLLDLDGQALNLDVDSFDGNEMSALLRVGSTSCKLEAEALTMKHDIHNTLVGDGWEAGLLLHVIGDILEIHLNARCSNHHLVLVLAGDLAAAEAIVVIVAELENVREQVVTLDDQVLNNGVDHWVGDFNTRDWHISSVLEDAWDDHVDEILDQVRLECGLSIVISAEIVEQLLHGVGQSLVLWILVKLIAHELELVHNTVGVVSVSIAEEEVSLIVEGVPLVGGLVLEDIALLLEASSDVLVHRFEPVLELGVLLGITVQLVYGVEEIVGRGRVGKTLDKGLEFCQRVFIIADCT
jgi:hypothetical protein